MTTEPPVREIPRPVLRGGRFFCPRCESRLQFDQEDFICLTCGYEYRPDAAEARRMFRRDRTPMYGVGAGAGMLAVAALLLGFGHKLATFGVLVLATVFVLLGFARLRGA